MATLHINLEKIISKKIEETLDEKISKAINDILENVISSIQFDIAQDSIPEGPVEGITQEEAEKELQKETEKKILEVLDNTKKKDEERGWVEKNNAYNYVTDWMKKTMSEEQLEKLAMPSDMTMKEYNFNKYIKTLSWDELAKLFKNNEYLAISIDEGEILAKELQAYGTTPTDIYYTLLKQILNKVIHDVIIINNPRKIENWLDNVIVDKFFKNFDSDVLVFIDELINEKHMEIFDYIFGEGYYMTDLPKYIQNQRKKNLDKPKIQNTFIDF